VPNFLARLPLTALATGLATSVAFSGAIPDARASEPGPMAYVFEGLDGPDLAAAPGLASVLADAQIAPAQPAPRRSVPENPVAARLTPEVAAPVAAALAAPILTPAPFQAAAPRAPIEAVAFALPQGPMPDGTPLAAVLAAAMPITPLRAAPAPDLTSTGEAPEPHPALPGMARIDAAGELPPLDAAQPPLLAAAAEAALPAQHKLLKPAVLSLLDGPDPRPALRPVPAVMPGPAESAETAVGSGDPPDTDMPEDPAVAKAVAAAEADPDPIAPSALDKPGETESLTDAIVASLKGNPEIQISLAQQDDAKYGVDEARAGYLPHVDVTAAWGREFARSVPQAPTQRFRSEATVSLNQNVWDFGVTINDIKRARATFRSAQWGTREKIEAISYDIANAYLGVLQQQKLVSLTEGEIAAVKKILRIVTVQKDLGLTTSADVERAQTRLENIRSQLLDRGSALQQARNAYKRLTDHMPERAADVPAAGQALPESADAAVDMIDTRSPRLAQAVEDRRSLDKQYDSQADSTLPRIGFTVASDYKRDVMGSTGRAIDARAMVTLSYRLYNGGATTAVKRRIGARLRQADYELDRRRREVEQDLRIDYSALGAAHEKIATIEDEITSAQRVADLYKQQFRGGRRTVFDLLDSEQVLFDARAKQITNQIALRAAEYRVLQKLGGLFDLVSGGQPLPTLAVPAPSSDD